MRNLARLMGGDVGVESDAGQGSRFWFRVRASLASVECDSSTDERAKNLEANTPGSLDKRTIPGGADEEEPVNAVEGKTIDIPQIVAMMRELEPLLVQNKFDSIGRVKALEAELAGTELAAEIADLSRLVSEFRFASGHILLRRIVARHNLGDLT